MLNFLDSLMDDALKKEAASEAKSDNFSSIMKVGLRDGCLIGLWLVTIKVSICVIRTCCMVSECGISWGLLVVGGAGKLHCTFNIAV